MKFLKFILLSTIGITLILLGFLGVFAYQVSRSVSEGKLFTKNIKIEQGMSLGDIAVVLKNENIILNRLFFILYAEIEGESNKLKAGTYEFNLSMSTKEIVGLLSRVVVAESVRVTIPEGFSNEQIAERLLSNGVLLNEKEFINLVSLSTVSAGNLLGYEFLKNISANSLEGFLFPDTYEFNLESEPKEIIEKFLVNFEIKAWPLLQNADALRLESIAGTYRIYEYLIIASLLEKEVQSEEDMKLVAGILYNRLEIGIPLQVDATLVYITGKKTGELTNADKLIDSPYNTYQHKGFPPAPIVNPGLKAINSALNPTPSNYFYYLSALDGTTYFAETLEGHNENKAKYLR